MNGPDPTESETALAKAPIDGNTHTAVAVVESVSEASDEPVRELPPLQAVVDADALDAVFEGRDDEGTLTFHYAGYVVCVRAHGLVTVHERAPMTR